VRGWQETEIGRLPSDWGTTTIENISEIVTDGAHLSPKFFNNGKCMCSVKDMRYNGFAFSDCKRISSDNFTLLKRQGCSPEKGDILISKDGEKCLDLIFVYSQDKEIVLLSSIAIIRLKENNSPHFYRYYLLSPVGQSIMKKWFRSGTAIPRVVLKDFRNVPVPKVAIQEQGKISNIFLCLDAKIENLQKQNQTLEKIAQTLFKQWFVDFNFPDENGKPYKDNGGAMVGSELGEIPMGWKVDEISRLIDVRDGTHASPKQANNGFPLVTSKHLKKNGIDFRSTYLISKFDYKEVNKRSNVDRYDILLSMIGTVGTLYFVMDSKIDFAIKNIGLFKTSGNLIFSEYIYLFFKSDYGLHYFKTRVAGTTQLYLTLGSLREFPIIVPKTEFIENFRSIVFPIFTKLHLNNKSIQALTKTRDTLLPKLMSGQIRVNN